jgi:hypothetical protein
MTVNLEALTVQNQESEALFKLYRLSEREKLFWETWEESPGKHTVHWGQLGTRGHEKSVKSSLWNRAQKVIQAEIDGMVQQGFQEVSLDDHVVLMIEYAVDGWGAENDLAKRHQLQNRMDELLGWTGLGHCDGGSIGSGTMEVCNFVVDFELAKRVIETDLVGSEFADYARIYEETD